MKPPDARIFEPSELVPRDATPNSIAEWKAIADGFLTDESCAFHRNVEISARYAWLYKLMPTCFKWAGMAAIASHHVRLALFPLRLDADRSGYVKIPEQFGSPEAADGRRAWDQARVFAAMPCVCPSPRSRTQVAPRHPFG